MYIGSGEYASTQSWGAQHVIDDGQQIGCRADGGIVQAGRGNQTVDMTIVGRDDGEVGRFWSTLQPGSILWSILYRRSANRDPTRRRNPLLVLSTNVYRRLGAAQPRRRRPRPINVSTAHRWKSPRGGGIEETWSCSYLCQSAQICLFGRVAVTGFDGEKAAHAIFGVLSTVALGPGEEFRGHPDRCQEPLICFIRGRETWTSKSSNTHHKTSDKSDKKKSRCRKKLEGGEAKKKRLSAVLSLQEHSSMRRLLYTQFGPIGRPTHDANRQEQRHGAQATMYDGC